MRDPYVYEGTNVLINKLDLKDEKLLDQIETAYAMFAIDGLKSSNFRFGGIFDCLEIHRQLFSDLYDWAGKLRTIDIFKSEPILKGKSVDYVFASYLKQALNELQKEFEKTDWDLLSPKAKLEKVCYFVSEFWHIHPFREGNTRTAAMMLYFLIKKVGLHVNIDFLSRNGKYFRNALVLSCLYSASKPDYLLGIVADSTSVKNEISGKYESIDGLEIDKYAYSYHTIERMETIQKPSDRSKK